MSAIVSVIVPPGFLPHFTLVLYIPSVCVSLLISSLFLDYQSLSFCLLIISLSLSLHHLSISVVYSSVCLVYPSIWSRLSIWISPSLPPCHLPSPRWLSTPTILACTLPAPLMSLPTSPQPTPISGTLTGRLCIPLLVCPMQMSFGCALHDAPCHPLQLTSTLISHVPWPS